MFTTDCISVESDVIQMACGFVYCHDGTPVDTLNFPKYQDMRNWFHDINDSYNKINIYYKSVYVKTINKTTLFKNVVGDINIKQGVDIKLDRTDLGIDEQNDMLFDEIDRELTNNLLLKIASFSHPNNFMHVEFIYMIYLAGLSGKNGIQFMSCIEKLLFFWHFNGETKSLSLMDCEKILSLDKGIIIRIEIHDSATIFDESDGYDVFVCSFEQTMYMYIQYLILKGYGIELHTSYNCKRVRFYRDRPSLISEYGSEYAISFNSSVVLWVNIDRRRLWNKNNPLIAWFIEHTDETKKDTSIAHVVKKTIDNIYFDYVYRHMDNRQKYRLSLCEINTQLSQLNDAYNVNFTATSSWFPIEMQSNIFS